MFFYGTTYFTNAYLGRLGILIACLLLRHNNEHKLHFSYPLFVTNSLGNDASTFEHLNYYLQAILRFIKAIKNNGESLSNFILFNL